MSTRILHVVANAQHGTALAELVDAWRVLEAAGFEQLLVSPAGGAADVDVDSPAGRAWTEDAARRVLLARTAAPGQIDAGDFDAVVCAAGADDDTVHASGGLERVVRGVAVDGGAVVAIGHADCALVRLSGAADGARPIAVGAVEAARALVARLATR
ncbi:hypothetical protein GCM10009846_12980 [Agrococcus versicolor]|uniref:DJ-1/PfpI domain-containing protein n=1 Tax=Agrococcus versicolor TaxID=501482 RepID=A0ABN3AP47_9MICO